MIETWGLGVGGSNLYLGKVDLETGRVDEFEKRLLKEFDGYAGVMDYVRNTVPRGSNIGACATGDLDDSNPLVVKYIANSPFDGKLDLEAHLAEHAGRLSLTGDVRGEVLAATKYDPALAGKATILATYSTGHGFDFAMDGRLILPRSNEAGHGLTHRPPLEYSFYAGMPCGCRTNDGAHDPHIEAYVSGPSSANMARKFFVENGYDSFKEHPIALAALDAFNSQPRIDPRKKKTTYSMTDLMDEGIRDEVLAMINGEMVYKVLKFRPNDQPQKNIRCVQEDAILQSILNMNALFSPDVILLKGSFAENDWDAVFKPAVAQVHDRTLEGFNPQLEIRRLDDPHISVKGGALYNSMVA